MNDESRGAPHQLPDDREQTKAKKYDTSYADNTVLYFSICKDESTQGDKYGCPSGNQK